MRWNLVLAQWETTPDGPEANAARAVRLLEDAPRADVVVFPELWTTGYAPAQEGARWPDSRPALSRIAGWARERAVNVVAGSVAEASAEGLRNTAWAFDRAGNPVARYDKVHLFRPFGEDALFIPGGRLCAFRLDGIPCAVLICYDLRFPEAARNLALMGARVLFVPARWPRQRIAHWRTLLAARAIENQCFVVGVNAASRGEGGERSGGQSMVIDPWGRVLVEGGAEAAVLAAEIDLAEVDAVRAAIPVFADRVPSVYGEAGSADG